MASRVFTMFFYDLTYWLCFWPHDPYSNLTFKIIILSKFDDDWTKTVASRVFTRFLYDLTYWPMFLTRYDPYSNLTEILVTMIILSKFWWWFDQNCGLYSAHNVFLLFYLLTLFFDPTSPIFEHYWDIVTMIILSKFDDDWTKSVASKVFTMFLEDLTYWPSFWSRHEPIFKLDWDIVTTIILSTFDEDWT